MTEIRKCTCTGTSPAIKFQDKTYGIGMRVMNINDKKEAKCTICGSKTKIV